MRKRQVDNVDKILQKIYGLPELREEEAMQVFIIFMMELPGFLKTILPRHQLIFTHRFGLIDGETRSYQEIAEALRVQEGKKTLSVERVRQMYFKYRRSFYMRHFFPRTMFTCQVAMARFNARQSIAQVEGI